jgi:murein DD-endopeptidase MepM/ murein hydrolase activator NlpD
VRRRLIVPGLAVAVAATSLATAYADPPPSPADQRMRELRQQVGEASEAEADLLDEVARAQARVGELDGAVRDLDAQAALAGVRLTEAHSEVDQLEAEHAAVKADLARARQEADGARQAVGRTVLSLYQQGPAEEQALATAIIASRSPHEMLTAARYLQGALRRRGAELDRLLALEATKAALEREVADKAGAARTALGRLVADRKKLDSLKTQVLSLKSDTRMEQAREADVLRKVRARKAEFLKQLALLHAESSAIGQMLRGIQKGQRQAPRRKGTFKAPSPAPVSSEFGPRVHPIFGDVRMHTGIDYAANAGDPIRAAGDGMVVWAGPRGGYGNVVVIDHGRRLATLYAHQSRMAVSAGQQVTGGQVIGFVGSTGFSTGPHLHFETRELGSPVDPLTYL